MVEFYKPAEYLTGDSVGYLMRRTLTRLAADVGRQMEPYGLTHAQWVPLFKLYRGHATTVAELARECEMDTGAMTRLLSRLEAKGLCRRIRSTVDRRIVNLELTKEGDAAAQQIPAVLCKTQNAYLRGFSEDEWHTLKDFLLRMLSNAQHILPEK